MTSHQTFPEPHFISTNGLKMAVYEQGDGIPVILCHGWPEIAYSWRHQIQPLVDAGFRAIAPDQRGYGRTLAPLGKDAVTQYDMEHLTGDLIGLLDALGIEKAIFCGHDWGGIVVWQLPLMHPSRVAGIIGVNTPFVPRPKYDPIETFRRAFGEDMYIVQFQPYGEAEKILARDTEASLRFFYRKVTPPLASTEKPAGRPKLSFLKALAEAPEALWPGEPLLNAEELATYNEAFKHSGWEGGINWYRNFTRNWQHSEGLVQKISVPCLMIAARHDAVLRPELMDGMENHISDLEKHVIEDCGHWTQAEKPEELNRLMIDWLKRRFG